MAANFDDGVARLNRCNLDNVLLLSCVVSTLEVHTPQDAGISRMLHREASRLIADAVVASSALSYKTHLLSRPDFIYIFNAVNDALNDRRIAVDMVDGSERARLMYGAAKFFSRFGAFQLRGQQRIARMQLGRLRATLELLPVSHNRYFPAALRSFAAGLPQLLVKILGASVRDLGAAHFLIVMWYQHLNQLIWQKWRAGSSQEPGHWNMDHRQADLLWALIETSTAVGAPILFTPAMLSGGNAVATEKLEALLRICARPIEVLRGLARTQRRAFAAGPAGLRLSPLERYPIVQLKAADGSPIYIAPNVRLHRSCLPDVLHFALFQLMADNGEGQYESYRGAAQEVYLRVMIETQLPSLMLVPESEYKRGSNSVLGADLTVFDPADGTLIMIESKARRATAETRLTMDEPTFDKNFEDVYCALKALPKKIEEVRRGVGAYAELAEKLRSAERQEPLCVCVVGEAVHFVNEMVRYRAGTEATHPLHEFPYPFCIMSVDTLETAVAIAAAEDVPLGQVLREHWDASARDDASLPAPEDFGGRELGALHTFAERFLTE